MGAGVNRIPHGLGKRIREILRHGVYRPEGRGRGKKRSLKGIGFKGGKRKGKY